MIKLEEDSVIHNNTMFVLYNEKTNEVLDYQFDSEFMDKLSLYYYSDRLEDDIEGIDGIEYSEDEGAYIIKYTGKTPIKDITVATVSGDFTMKSIVRN